MIKFLVYRALQSVVVLFGASIIAFLLIYASGDPSALLLGSTATKGEIAAFRHSMGLDKPIWVQYAHFAAGILRGKFPASLSYRQNPLTLVLERFPATGTLAVSALGIAILISLPVGLLLARKPRSWASSLVMSAAIIGYSTPVYWEAMMLVLVFSLVLKWFPPSGTGSILHLVLPSVALATQLTALVLRMVWGSAVEILATDYVVTARAKGLAEWKVLSKHVLRNCLIPVITIVGLELAGLLGNAIMAEVIFAWPGVARLAVQAIFQRDYPLVQACVMFMAVVFVVANLLVDFAYGLIDPRIRYA